MHLDMKKIGGSDVLAGALNGRRAFGVLVGLTAQQPLGPEPLFLDFRKVRVATASFLRESVLAIRNLVRGQRSNFYPVVANASQEICDEFRELVAGHRSDVLITCDLSESGTVSNV